MARGSNTRGTSVGWLASLLGATFLVVSGFLLGLVVGVVKEQPELVVGHLAGRSEEVPWTDEAPIDDHDAPEFARDEIEIEQREVFSDRRAARDALEAETSVTLEELPPISPPSMRTVEPETYEPHRPNEQAQAGVAVSDLPEVSARGGRAAPAPGEGGFSVQVGAFGEGAAAQRVADDLADKGFPVYVTSNDGSGKWRVRVGPVASRAEADRLARKLKVEESLPTWVLSEGGG